MILFYASKTSHDHTRAFRTSSIYGEVNRYHFETFKNKAFKIRNYFFMNKNNIVSLICRKSAHFPLVCNILMQWQNKYMLSIILVFLKYPDTWWIFKLNDSKNLSRTKYWRHENFALLNSAQRKFHTAKILCCDISTRQIIRVAKFLSSKYSAKTYQWWNYHRWNFSLQNYWPTLLGYQYIRYRKLNH